MSPRFHLAHRAIERDREVVGRGRSDDLADLRLTALAFEVAVWGPRPIVVAHAVDEDGVEHWLGARSAVCGIEAAYVQLLSDLLLRGLQTGRPPLVDAGGYPRFARRLEHALGPVVHVGVPATRECGGGGLVW